MVILTSSNCTSVVILFKGGCASAHRRLLHRSGISSPLSRLTDISAPSWSRTDRSPTLASLTTDCPISRSGGICPISVCRRTYGDSGVYINLYELYMLS